MNRVIGRPKTDLLSIKLSGSAGMRGAHIDLLRCFRFKRICVSYYVMRLAFLDDIRFYNVFHIRSDNHEKHTENIECISYNVEISH
jgi:hypothetical protein